MTWVVDFDDQCDAWDALPYLLALKEKYPKFKVTLFTIPAECSYPHLLKLKQYDWIELALHGWTHRINNEHNPREMQDWDARRTRKYLELMLDFYPDIFINGLKAPGWQISNGTYEVLDEYNIWVMDQPYNNERRPKGLKYYLVGAPENIHGHTWDCNGGCNNSIETLIHNGTFDAIQPDDEFKFVSEAVQ